MVLILPDFIPIKSDKLLVQSTTWLKLKEAILETVLEMQYQRTKISNHKKENDTEERFGVRHTY